MAFWFLFFMAIAIALIILFHIAGLTIWQMYFCIVAIELCLFFAVSIIRSYRMSQLLDEKCDPEKYLEKTLRQKDKLKRKPKLTALLTINEAAAYMLLGNFNKAENILSGIDKDNLSDKNGSYFTYLINSIICNYELGRIEEGDRIYEIELPPLILPGKKNKLTLQMLIGDRLYYKQRYDESYQHMAKLMDIELNRRQQVEILYRMAQIDALRGDYGAAFKKYRKVAKFGNKLWIAHKSEEILQEEIYRDLPGKGRI
jgi:hypothetical protein